jgi:FkbM family methyltransferase
MSLVRKLWNNSPKAVWHAVNRRLTGPRARPAWTDVKAGPLKGGQLYLDVHSFDGWQEMIDGRFDSFIYDEIARSCTMEGAVCWDIGAHFGFHSLSFASLVGDRGHVYSFEPNPFNATRFRMHLERNEAQARRITLNTFALSDSDGELSLVLSEDVDGSSSSGSHLENANVPLEAGTYSNFKSQTVQTRTIDSFQGSGVRIPNIVKVDVEGAEMLVLKGGRAFFEKHRPVMFLEVHNIVMMHHVYEFLSTRGYSVRILDEDGATLSKCFVVARPT